MDDRIIKLVAQLGSKKHLDKMLSKTQTKDGSWYAKKMIARHTKHKEHLDKLVDDSNSGIREVVANRGHSDHLDKLVDDPDPWVREQVAYKTNDPKHLDKLVHDKKLYVRAAVVHKGIKKYHDMLINDYDVHYAIAQSSNHLPTLKKLSYPTAEFPVSGYASRAARTRYTQLNTEANMRDHPEWFKE